MNMYSLLIVTAAMVCQVPAKAATRIGVVNVASVSEKYLKTRDLESQFEALRKSLGQQRDAMKEKIERANRALQEELKPGTDAYRLRRKEIALLEAELQWFIDTEGQKVEKGLAESLKSIFDDIYAAVKEVADELGLDIVLAADKLPAEAPDTPNQARQTILLQKVVYWKPDVDITETVVARLNARYQAPAGSPPATDRAQNPAKPKDTKKP